MEYKYKPDQEVVVDNVKNASAVGYLGVHYNVCDYVSTPNLIKIIDGEPVYLCKSINSGFYNWFYESELRG